MILRTRAGAVGSLAALALSLAACSASSSTPQALVPTLPATGAAHQAGAATASANAGAASASADAGRPRLRIDMTQAETQAMWVPYQQCLTANGYDKSRHADNHAGMTKAQQACVSSEPLPPWQEDQNNPQAADFVHALVQCLRAKGVKYVTAAPPVGGMESVALGGPNNDASSITLGMEYMQPCEEQVAAQGIGN